MFFNYKYNCLLFIGFIEYHASCIVDVYVTNAKCLARQKVFPKIPLKFQILTNFLNDRVKE